MFSEEMFKKMTDLFEEGLGDVQVEVGEIEGEDNHFCSACFVPDKDTASQSEDRLLDLYIYPMIRSLAQEVSGMGVVRTKTPRMPLHGLGPRQWVFATRVPFRFTGQYTTLEWTGRYRYNDDGSPHMCPDGDDEDGELVHAKKYESGTRYFVDALVQKVEN
jgi:hypothetical protein